jgi:hypothetical protein
MSSSTTRLASFKIIISFNQNFESYLIVDTSSGYLVKNLFSTQSSLLDDHQPPHFQY